MENIVQAAHSAPWEAQHRRRKGHAACARRRGDQAKTAGGDAAKPRRMDICDASMSRLEGQRRKVQDYEIPILADALGVSVAWLLGTRRSSARPNKRSRPLWSSFRHVRFTAPAARPRPAGASLDRAATPQRRAAPRGKNRKAAKTRMRHDQHQQSADATAKVRLGCLLGQKRQQGTCAMMFTPGMQARTMVHIQLRTETRLRELLPSRLMVRRSFRLRAGASGYSFIIHARAPPRQTSLARIFDTLSNSRPSGSRYFRIMRAVAARR